MLIGYPSMIEEIKESGFSQSFLSAAPFPKSLGENDRISIDYNYFVINKTTQNIKEASTFLSYLVSDEGADDYYDIFTSRIPADETILNSKLESKIDEKFNVVYQNFLRNGTILVSYDR
jgi:ABC-type glycerol-3-phosphate transport system substrate-binding protein